MAQNTSYFTERKKVPLASNKIYIGEYAGSLTVHTFSLNKNRQGLLGITPWGMKKMYSIIWQFSFLVTSAAALFKKVTKSS